MILSNGSGAEPRSGMCCLEPPFFVSPFLALLDSTCCPSGLVGNHVDLIVSAEVVSSVLVKIRIYILAEGVGT